MDSKVLPWWDVGDRRKYRSVLWNVTRQCNKDCAYCPFHDNSLPDLPREAFAIAAENVGTQLARYSDMEYIQLILFGGEPTLVGMDVLMMIIRETNIARAILTKDVPINLLMYSNMSQPYPFYRKLILSGMTRILASYHGKSMEDAEQFLDLIRMFRKDGLEESIQVMLMESDAEVWYVAEQLTNMEIWWDMFKPHRHGVKAESPKEGSAIIDVTGWKTLVHANQNNLQGWNCLAGTHHAYIEYNGTIYPCQGIGQGVITRKLFGKAWARGSILRGDPLFGNTETVCPMKACRFEVNITKYKNV